MTRVPYGIFNVKRSLLQFILGRFISLVIGFGFFILLAKALKIEDFGFYIILVATLEIVGLMSNFGSFFISQRYIPELMQTNDFFNLKKLISFLLVFRLFTLLISGIVLYFLAEILLNYIAYLTYLWVLQIYLLVIIIENFIRYLEMIFDSLLLQGYTQISVLFRNSIRFFAVLYLYFLTTDNSIFLNQIVVIELLSGILGAFLTIFLLFKFLRQLPDSEKNFKSGLDFTRYFAFARPGYYAQLISLSYSVHILKLLVIKFFGATETALFGFTSTFIAMLARYMPSVLLVGMIRPLFITAYNEKDQFKKLHHLTNITIKINLLAVLPIIIYFAVFGEEVVRMLVGDKFSNSGVYLFLFSIVMLLQIYHVMLSQLNMAHEGGKNLLSASFYSMFGVLVGLMFFPLLMQYSIVLGLILSEVIFCSVLLKKLLKDKVVNLPEFKSMFVFLGVSLLSFVSVGLIHLFYAGDSLGYLIGMLLFLLSTFYLALYIYKPFTTYERDLINKVLPLPYFCF